MRTSRGLLYLFLPALLLAAGLAHSADKTVVVQGGTVLTVTSGTFENASIIIVDGKITAVGANLSIPSGAIVIDASGKFIMPGIIDGHAHIALDRDVNEATSPVTAQVRMKDAFIPDDYAIYRTLAGGVTTSKFMHGSANVIGGVSLIAKLKYGKTIDEMIIPGVRPLIKMALGENPKRVYGGRNQMPSTRPGVFAVMRQKFLDAQAYKLKWDAYNKKLEEGKETIPPKRDLQMDTLVDVLEGKIGIDCHCYVGNEIVVLLTIMDEFNLPLVTISHALEAYKVADELARRGVSVQTHSDWWGYKWEAYNAIPYNIGMLLDAGVNASIISDSGDVARRMPGEAAKLVKYSGLTDDQALATITINAARAVGIAELTGSIEVGKDGDLAIFDKHPLDSFSRCVMTIIEGEVMFDIDNVKTAFEK